MALESSCSRVVSMEMKRIYLMCEMRTERVRLGRTCVRDGSSRCDKCNNKNCWHGFSVMRALLMRIANEPDLGRW